MSYVVAACDVSQAPVGGQLSDIRPAGSGGVQVVNAPERSEVAIPTTATSLLRTLVVSDLAGSTALVERLGDQRAAGVIRQHDRLVRDLRGTEPDAAAS